MKKYLFVLFLFLTGCFNNPTPPSWYLNTPKSNDVYIYASAEGNTKKEAIDSALSYLASKLQVKITSSFNTQKSYIESNGEKSVYQNLSQNIKTSVENFTFYNYETDKLEKKGEKYYALVKINRIKNAEKIIQNIKNSLKNLPKLNDGAIINLQNAIKAQKKINKLKNSYKLAKILNPDTDTIAFPEIYNKTIQSTSFSVVSNDKELKNLLLNYISKKYTISNNPDITIKADIGYSIKKIVGQYLANANLTMTISDNKTQKSYFYTCAASSYNPGIAKKLALKKCAIKAQKTLQKLFY